MIVFEVRGEPKPAGSKKAFVHPKTGKAIVTEDSKNKSWMHAVATAALDEVGEGFALLEGPLSVTFTFHRLRPKGHFGSGKNSSKLKPSAPACPTTRPDVLKLARAVEDALTGVVWRDDSQIVMETLTKQYSDKQGVVVIVREVSDG